MSVLGSVRNRLKTMFIINKNKKYRLEKENKKIVKTKVIITKKNNPKTNLVLKKISVKKLIISKVINKPKRIVLTVNEPKKGKRKEINNNYSIKNNSIPKNSITNNEFSKKEDITRRFKTFIKKSKNEIKLLKKELLIEEAKLKQIKSQKEFEICQNKINIIKEKIEKLKNLYNNIINNYDFDGYDEINDFLLAKYIDDFKFISSSSDIDLLVKECKDKINYLDEIDSLVKNLEDLEIKKDIKKQKIDYFNKDYNNRLIDYDNLLKKETIIDRYLFKEQEYINNLEKEINNNELNTKITSKLEFNHKYINNLYKLNIGLSLFNKTYIGAFIGAFLIKSSLTPLLLKAFNRKEITKYSYKYKEYTNKITDNLSLIKQTNYLLTDSLRDIKTFRNYMEVEYKDYLKADKYNDLYKKIIYLEKDLTSKQKNNTILENKLLMQKQKNQEKQKRLEQINKL